jgi:hypothetical protein
MCKRSFLLYFLSLVLCLFVQTGTQAADSSLVGWWKLDEISGKIAVDSSSKGNNGILRGGPQWINGMINGGLQLDGLDDYVDLPIGLVISSLTDCTIAFWVNFTGFDPEEDDWQHIFDFGNGTSDYIFLTPNGGSGGPVSFAIRTTEVGAEDNVTGTNPLRSGWHHVAVTISEANRTIIMYIDGTVIASNTNVENKLSDLGFTRNNWFGRSQFYVSDPQFEGSLDDFYIYNRALLQEEIESLMSGGGLKSGFASEPYPADQETDVLRDVTLVWLSGKFAVKHNVYFGTNFDDVNNADTSSPLLVGPGQSSTIFDPGRLEFEQTYFWRVDEVNAPPDSTVYKGDIWSFTVEPLAYPVPAGNIIATASSYSPGQGPEKTIDGSGLTGELHSTVLTKMWLSQPGDPGSAWIQYEFNKVDKLHEMLVWNYNGESFLVALGLQSVVVEYSTDGANWTPVENATEFAQASGLSDYTYNTTVALGDVPAKYVKITANNNWGGGGFFNQYGLSEVRFMCIPVGARQPEPDDGAVDVPIDVTLGWRAGREAAEHKVYLNSDPQAVIDGTVPAVTVQQTEYGPLSLDLSQMYYWRVDEVNNIEPTPTWQSDLWSFTTREYLAVDDFESYNDIPEGTEGSNLVYSTWTDGYANPSTNGSTIGYVSGSSLETDIVHGGRNSVPIMYDNTTASISEVTANTSDLAIGKDWTVGSPEMLVLWVYGNANNPATDRMYVKVNGVKVVYDGDLAQTSWQEFSIDMASLGVNLSNVTTLTIGFERIGATGGSGVVYIDDIRLYAPAVAQQ